MTLYLKLEENFEKAMKMARDVVRNTIMNYPGAQYLMSVLYSNVLPLKMFAKLSQSIGAKHTIVFSNVAGFVKPVFYNGAKFSELYYLATATGSCATCMTCVSTLDKIRVTLTADSYQIDDIDSLIGFFNDLIREHGLEYEQSNAKS